MIDFHTGANKMFRGVWNWSQRLDVEAVAVERSPQPRVLAP